MVPSRPLLSHVPGAPDLRRLANRDADFHFPHTLAGIGRRRTRTRAREPERAHEKVYIETILDGEFEQRQVDQATPYAATVDLVAGYAEAAEHGLTGLGYLHGTEVVDLPMVSAVGELMRRCTGKRNLAWVNIHVLQEPNHVESSRQALEPEWDEAEQWQIIHSAEELWRLWINFFKSIQKEILV